MAKKRRSRCRPNIVLFGIDSLRRDHMSCYGYARLTTPHIDRFAQEGTLFENTFSAHIPTTSAYASMLTVEMSSGRRLSRCDIKVRYVKKSQH